MKNIMSERQSEALTKFGVEHDRRWSMKVAHDLLQLAIYTANSRRSGYDGYVISARVFEVLRKKLIKQELTRDEVALIYLWKYKVDQDVRADKEKYGSRLDEGF